MSGFQHAPGSAERREADREWIELHKTAPVKNPRRYNVANDRAFGITAPIEAGGWEVKWRAGSGGRDVYQSLDELLDDGWTVD